MSQGLRRPGYTFIDDSDPAVVISVSSFGNHPSVKMHDQEKLLASGAAADVEKVT
jgi:hypothetical protein